MLTDHYLHFRNTTRANGYNLFIFFILLVYWFYYRFDGFVALTHVYIVIDQLSVLNVSNDKINKFYKENKRINISILI